MKQSKSVLFFALLVILLSTILCISGCASPEPALIPREVLFGNPVKTQPTFIELFQATICPGE